MAECKFAGRPLLGYLLASGTIGPWEELEDPSPGGCPGCCLFFDSRTAKILAYQVVERTACRRLKAEPRPNSLLGVSGPFSNAPGRPHEVPISLQTDDEKRKKPDRADHTGQYRDTTRLPETRPYHALLLNCHDVRLAWQQRKRKPQTQGKEADMSLPDSRTRAEIVSGDPEARLSPGPMNPKVRSRS
ncbi:hypothetical protein VTJ04DRAFT_2337 [Mycothermus thermophilus]|uniref:uncharacterized protein n=1 Tax=Humicola insolens TaxID=85995 RepID=UPI0037442F93